MKTIAPAAMAAIEAGEAIVTGAVEITKATSGPTAFNAGDAVTLSWQQSTFEQTTNDEARMGFAFLDGSGAIIGVATWATMIATTSGVWTERSLTGTVPAGTEQIRIYQEMQRISGINNDGFIDDIGLTVGGLAATILNPGAELGTADWTNETGAIGIFTGNKPPPPHGGSSFFTGGSDALSRAYQDISPDPVSALRLWGGNGTIVNGGNAYLGVGDRAFVQQSAGAIGGIAQGLNIGLSGIEPNVLALMDDVASFRGASVVVYRLIFASDGKTLLDWHVFDRGRIDTIQSDETIGAAAAITAAMESAARGLGRSGARMRSDPDQRLTNSADGYFAQTAYAPQKELYWGGTKPVRTGTVNGAGPVAGTIGGTGDGF